MEIFLLCLLAILIARHVKKRSVIISCCHSVLFAFIFVLSLFTINFPLVNAVMNFIFGEELFTQIQQVLLTPCFWFYSAATAAAITELFIILIATALAAKYAAHRIHTAICSIYRDFKDKNYRLRLPEINIKAQRKIFLTYCRLLN